MRTHTTAAALLLLLFVGTARADGADEADSQNRENWTAPDAGPNQGAMGDLDPRLPPVLPGETVVRGGKKMKVISTSGPVPVSTAAEVPSAAGEIPQGIGVVIDRRPPERGISAPLPEPRR